MNQAQPSFAPFANPRRAVPGAPVYAHRAGALAVGDRYFGRVLMSVPEVRYWLRDLSQRIEAHPAEADAIFGEAVFVEDALRDWAQKSPADPILPNYIHCLSQLYRAIGTRDACDRTSETMEWLASFMTIDYAAPAKH
jgi:hypothetical protein